MNLQTLGGLSLAGADFSRVKPLLLLTYVALEGTRDRRHLAELFWPDSADALNSLSAALKQLKKVPGLIEADKVRVWSTLSCDASAFLAASEANDYEEALTLYRGSFLSGVYLSGWSAELEEWVYATREVLAGRFREVRLRLGEEAAARGAYSEAAKHALAAYALREAVEPETGDIKRLYTLLRAADHPQAAALHQAGQAHNLALGLSVEEAKTALSKPSGHSTITHNLPSRATSFIGRESERAALGKLLETSRFTSLIGLAGVGKTGLALQVAREQVQQESFSDGIYFIPLDALNSYKLIPNRIAEGLSLGLEGGEDALEQVVRHIGSKRMLLLLDNYEHLMEGAALPSALLERCPNLKLLITSRGQLNLEQERVLLLNDELHRQVMGLSVTTQVAVKASSAQAGSAPPLPRATTVFVERPELHELHEALQQPNCQLLTLLGAGGVGKTRLALELAHQALADSSFGHHVYFVPLESLSKPEDILTSLLSSFSLPPAAREKEPLGQIISHLKNTAALLVLDNFEHLLGAVTWVSQLVLACPKLKVLVTSRERLQLVEEWLFPLEGFKVPEPALPFEDALAYQAVQLFLQTAKRVKPDFKLEPGDLSQLIRLLELVEGLPLAIELAAVWVRMMPLAHITEAIAANLDFLSSSVYNLPERHRSIRAAFEHSWRLLSHGEQEVLRKLSVFRGGFTKEAAAVITEASVAVLASLVDKSLLRVNARGRYDQHPLLYTYTREKLAENASELSRCGEQHGRYYLHSFWRWGDRLQSLQGDEALSSIEEELQNIHGAWRWALTDLRLGELQQSIPVIRSFCERSGQHREGLALLKEAQERLSVAKAEHHSILGETLGNQAHFLFRLGNHKQASELARQSHELLRPLGPNRGMLDGLNTLGAILRRAGDYSEAKSLLEEALEVADACEAPFSRAVTFNFLALVEQSLGQYERAEAHYAKALAFHRSSGDQGLITAVLNNIGNMFLDSGQPQRALPFLQEGIGIARAHHFTQPLCYIASTLGSTFDHLGHDTEALSLYEEAITLAQKHGERWVEAFVLTDLGSLLTRRADYAQARTLLLRALSISKEVQSVPMTLRAIVRLAEWHLVQGQAEDAAYLLGTLNSHEALAEGDRKHSSRSLEAISNLLPAAVLHRTLERGKALTLEQLIQTLL